MDIHATARRQRVGRSDHLPADARPASMTGPLRVLGRDDELQQWAIDAEARGVQSQHRSSVMPLHRFPDSHLAEIRADVESDVKPPFWRDLGLAQIPSRSWYEWHWQRGIDPDARRPPIPTWIRERVLARDGDVCQLCGGTVPEGDVHLDHIKPWSKGGEHSVANLQVTHSKCNMRKAARY